MSDKNAKDQGWLTEGPVTIQLTVAEALVLDALFARSGERHERDGLTIEDEAEWHALWTVAAALERALVETFSSDYRKHLERARREVREADDVG